jgi:hypothetical protein
MRFFEKWGGSREVVTKNPKKTPTAEISGAGAKIEQLPITLEEESLLAPVEKQERLSHRVQFLTLENGETVLFKPLREKLNPESRDSFAQKERAAFIIDKVLGLGIVPPTNLREVDGNFGSVQKFITDAKEGIEITDEEIRSLEFLKIFIFDYIIAISDRDYQSRRNMLVKDSKVMAIDNELTFECGGWPAKIICEKELPPEIIEGLKKFSSGGEEILKNELSPLLSADAIEKCLQRIRALAYIIDQYNGQIPKTEFETLRYPYKFEK